MTSFACASIFSMHNILLLIAVIFLNSDFTSAWSSARQKSHAGVENDHGRTESTKIEYQSPSGDASQHPTDRIGWTSKPICSRQSRSGDKYCVYTSSTFATGRGISIIATPEGADEFLSNSPAFSSELHQTMETNQVVNPPFMAQEIEGHGIGLVANRTIVSGEWLMSYTPAIVIPEAAREDLLPSERLRLQRIAVSQLPTQLRQTVEALFGQGGEDLIDDIIDTNSFSVPLSLETHRDEEEDDDEDEQPRFNVLFPEIARLNHACRPNANYLFDAETLSQHVAASRDIFPGEEIKITYIDPLQRRKARTRALHKSWGFKCDCDLCQAAPDIVAISDSRIDKILELQEEMEDHSPYSEATPASAELMISLIKKEQVWNRVPDAYALAAFEYNGVGHAGKAQTYAGLALRQGVGCRSSQHSDEMYQDLEFIRAMPMNHSSWQFRI